MTCCRCRRGRERVPTDICRAAKSSLECCHFRRWRRRRWTRGRQQRQLSWEGPLQWRVWHGRPGQYQHQHPHFTCYHTRPAGSGFGCSNRGRGSRYGQRSMEISFFPLFETLCNVVLSSLWTAVGRLCETPNSQNSTSVLMGNIGKTKIDSKLSKPLRDQLEKIKCYEIMLRKSFRL